MTSAIDSDRVRDPIFIVGCPRSGTTLLQRLLDAHSGAAIAPETHFMRRFWRDRQVFGDLRYDPNYHRLLTEVTATPEFSDMQIDTEMWIRAAWQGERSYAALFWLLLSQFAETRNVGVIGEKTPNHIFFLADLHNFFPAARFLHIVRDPRAVVNSWRHCPWTSGVAWRDAVRWRRHIRAAFQGAVPGLYTLFYEQLVQEPEACVRDFCRFLGLSYEPEMLLYHEQPSHAFDPQREPWKDRALQPIAGDLASSWQTELSADDIAAVEAVTWREMQHYGYRPLTPPARLLPLFLLFRLRMAGDRIRRATLARRQRLEPGSATSPSIS